MKILVVAPWVPSSRRPRSLGLLNMLAQEHELSLVAACWSEEDWDDLDKLPYRTTGARLGKPTAMLRAAVGLVRSHSLQQAYLDSPSMRRALRQEVDDFRPDLMYFNTLRSAQWRSIGRGIPRVIDLDEFRSSYYDQVARSSSSLPSRAVGFIEGRRMRAEEGRIVDAFERVLVSSPLDLSPARPDVRLVRSPDALGDRSVTAARLEPTKSRIVFVGRMSYGANVAAVRWFVKEVLPSVVESDPTVTLQIVGDSPAAGVLALASERVQVLGRVPEVGPYYSAAQVSIVPVTTATGVQMKLIESLRMSVPTVVTPLVAEQAGVSDGAEVVVADDALQWSTAIVKLLRDRTFAADVASRGAAWAEANYSTPAIRESLLAALSPLVGSGSQSATGGVDPIDHRVDQR